MDVMGLINESVMSNTNLTNEIRENIMELITIFHTKIKDVSLDNFNDRVKTLNIKAGSKYEMKDIAFYDATKNTLYLNRLAFDEREGKNILMYGLLQIITSTGKYSGFNTNSNLEALKIGVTELLVDYLVGSDYNDAY